ncbi:hypothetical protein [Dongshaea marina]|uniref:hypothetical protein n=1 Tax=Dongshaea marina TaxID=2047966 RepID=UPI000D3E4795|nr:hypothetical protein [Dongshaea marina]
MSQELESLLHKLSDATSFELYRLKALIDAELADPVRIEALHRVLQVGQRLHYYDSQQRLQIPCELIEIRNKYLRVKELAGAGREVTIPGYMLNLDGQSVEPSFVVKQPLGRHQLSVGERVGFHDKKGQPHYGVIERLNHKTVTLKTDQGRWRVAYSYLFSVVDGETQVFEMLNP